MESIVLTFADDPALLCVQDGSNLTFGGFEADQVLPPPPHHAGILVCVDVAGENNGTVVCCKGVYQRLYLWDDSGRAGDEGVGFLVQEIFLHIQHKQRGALGMKNDSLMPASVFAYRSQHSLGFGVDG